ncbi:MAG TPA: PEP-CTERM sorting domain-containing protein, partial [Terriglobales bacterium]|nr:PEP-CTERM sorting domain-containing protein [Terriglobales bacterium]
TLLSSYDYPTDGAKTVLVLYNVYPFPEWGVVDYFQSYVTPRTQGTFMAMVLRPEGNDQYRVMYGQSFQAPALSNAQLWNYDILGEPWKVRIGDIYAHYGNGIPLNLPNGGPNLSEPIYYDIVDQQPQPIVGDTISIPSSTYPYFSQDRDYGLAAHLVPTPEPASFLLLGAGLAAIAFARRKSSH